jgi:predicted ATPase
VSWYGGTGKTRFSIELFRRHAPGYQGGAAFVSLASVTEAAEVMSTVTSTLDIAEAHGRSDLEAVATVIGTRPFLLILDNLEQVLDAATDIAELVARCPALQVVATSRAPLKIGAELEFPLPPLEIPDKDEHAPERLRQCPSIELFVQRALKVKPGFQLDETNADAVSGICRQLDGLPLALELAAARVRILEPARLLQRLDHALDLLSSGDRDLPLRQRTLRATISWSYSLLEAPEQQLLRRCSVFHEGWTFEAMEQVCYDDEDRWRALDELESLVEKGLVRVIAGGARYSLLETIRAFAAEQLHTTGETDKLRDRHAQFIVDWMATLADDFRSARQVESMAEYRADNANELAAIHWLLARAREGSAEALENVMLLCGRLDWFWHVSGMHNTARGLYDEALALARDNPPSTGKGLAWLGAAMVSITTGEWDRSFDEWTAGYETGAQIGNDAIAAEGLMGIGYVHLNCGRLAEAREPIERSIELSTDDSLRALSMSIRGMLLFQDGDLDGGTRVVDEALRIQQNNRDCEGGGISLSFLASMSFARGDLQRARELYVESERTFEEVGDRPEVARVQCEAGWTALADDDSTAAGAIFRRALLTYEEVGSPRGTGLAMLGLAAVEAAEGRAERAVVIGAAAQALEARAGVVCDHPMDPGVVERIESLKATIPQGAVDDIVAKAGALSPADVLVMLAESQPA